MYSAPFIDLSSYLSKEGGGLGCLMKCVIKLKWLWPLFLLKGVIKLLREDPKVMQNYFSFKPHFQNWQVSDWNLKYNQMIWAFFLKKCVEGTLYMFAIFIIQIKEVVVWSSRNTFFEKKPCSLRKHTLPYVRLDSRRCVLVRFIQFPLLLFWESKQI